MFKIDLDSIFPDKGNQKFCGDCTQYPGEDNSCILSNRCHIHATRKACNAYKQATQDEILQHFADDFDKIEIAYGSLTGLIINDLLDEEE